MLLDMNSYFASVEQQANPLLRGRPVGVCAYLSPRSCVIAASIEAKEFGVRTGMRVGDARIICPHIHLLENEPAKYRFVSEKIFSILAQYSDNVSPFSIDEAFVDLTGQVGHNSCGRLGSAYDEAVLIAKEIKTRIRQEVGSWLKCSIGISFTSWLAKFAAEEKKPDGLTVITKSDLGTIFQGRPLPRACGIADRLETRLRVLGIYDLGQLQQTNPQKLLTALGKYGYYLWAHLNGLELSHWIKSEGNEQKSIGHSYCLPKLGRDKQYLQEIMFKLCEKTGRRLRQQGLVARSIYSGWSYVEGSGNWQSRRLSYPIFTTQDIWREAVRRLLAADLTDKVRLLAVSVGSLTPFVNQMSFWHDARAAYRLGQALDDINDRYGEYTVYQGLLHKVKEQARDRIGFRKSVPVNRPV